MVDFSIKNRSKKGFTLMELLVVVVLIGIVSSAAMSIFINANAKSRNAQRDTDVRSIVSSATFMRLSLGYYPVNSQDFSDNAKNFISDIPRDPESSKNISLLGQPLGSYNVREYTFSYYDFPVVSSEDRVLASTYFEPISVDSENEKNHYHGRYLIGTMTGPTSQEMWSQGVSYSVGQTNPGTILLRE